MNEEAMNIKISIKNTWETAIERDKADIEFAREQILWGKKMLKKAKEALEIDEKRLCDAVKDLS